MAAIRTTSTPAMMARREQRDTKKAQNTANARQALKARWGRQKGESDEPLVDGWTAFQHGNGDTMRKKLRSPGGTRHALSKGLSIMKGRRVTLRESHDLTCATFSPTHILVWGGEQQSTVRGREFGRYRLMVWLFCTKIRRPIYVNRFVGRYRLMVWCKPHKSALENILCEILCAPVWPRNHTSRHWRTYWVLASCFAPKFVGRYM